MVVAGGAGAGAVAGGAGAGVERPEQSFRQHILDVVLHILSERVVDLVAKRRIVQHHQRL